MSFSIPAVSDRLSSNWPWHSVFFQCLFLRIDITFNNAIIFFCSLFSPSHYYSVRCGVSADYYGYPCVTQCPEEYPVYPARVRPDSICSLSAVGGFDRCWAVEEKRYSLRDGPNQLYGPLRPRDRWGQKYFGGMETSMRRLSIQPRSRSVPRSPSSGGPYSPVPPHFASPARSPPTCFERLPTRMRDDIIFTDPSIYSLRSSLSSPKVKQQVSVFLLSFCLKSVAIFRQTQIIQIKAWSE